jgi:hypothetical protein
VDRSFEPTKNPNVQVIEQLGRFPARARLSNNLPQTLRQCTWKDFLMDRLIFLGKVVVAWRDFHAGGKEIAHSGTKSR